MESIYARNTMVTTVTPDIATQFVSEHHRDGFVRRVADMVSIGLLHNNELVAVSVFGNPRTSKKRQLYTKELVRMAFKSDVRVVGGASKMIKHAMNVLNFYDIFTYQDMTGEATDVYELSGMRLVSQDKSKEYLVKDGYTLATAGRKEKYGMAYVAQYGPDRILGTTFGQDTGLSNKELFMSAGYHSEFTDGDRVYEWFNPNWTHFVYKTTACDGSPGYYIGVHSVPLNGASEQECVDFDSYVGSGVGKFSNWKDSKDGRLEMSVLNIATSRTAAFNLEAVAIGDKFTTDVNCKNSIAGGRGASRMSSNRYIPESTNTLAHLFPAIAAEWHTPKNGLMTPSDYAAKSSQKVWWVCEHNHEWEAVISDRTSGTGCPVCSNKVVLKGFNDLATTNPELALMWSKRNLINPDEVSIGSGKKVWWLDACGHEYEAVIHSKSSHGCPICSGNIVASNYNSLNATHPLIADMLVDSSLGDELSAGSTKKVMWVGNCGHTWERSVDGQVKSQVCPFCSNRKVLPSFNDLETIHPDVAKDWDYDKNNILPSEVLPGSNKEYWWKSSDCDHSWLDSVKRRVNSKGCPYESGRLLVGYNDLATLHPEILDEWDDTRLPSDFTSKSSKTARWVCRDCGHKWGAKISNRANGAGCPNWRNHS